MSQIKPSEVSEILKKQIEGSKAMLNLKRWAPYSRWEMELPGFMD